MTRIEVDVTRPRPCSLVLAYIVIGKIDALALPPVTASERADELWRHTCFEAFAGAGPETGYYEFNLAPSTQWAAYRFDSYRSGMRLAAGIAKPQIAVEAHPERYIYILRASLELDHPQEAGENDAERGNDKRVKDKRTSWRVGLSAVIEDAGGRRSYWALAHPPGKPDFHHPDCFTLELA